MESTDQSTIRQMSIQLEWILHAPRPRVWAALTNELSAWWGAPYLVNDTDATALRLEAHLGGRFYEVWAGEDGVLWGTVHAIQEGRWLEIQGQLGMSQPVSALASFELEDRDDYTLFRFNHLAVGPLSDNVERMFTEGWDNLFGTRLRAWVEQGIRMGIQSV